jgi:predicted HNH restriction endonuclease
MDSVGRRQVIGCVEAVGKLRNFADLRQKVLYFQKWNGPEGYLRFLREKCGFKPEPIAKSAGSYDSDSDATFSFPEEVAEPQLLYEGAVYQVSVNAYERNPEARRKCIEYYGASCFVCSFNFGEVYGEADEGFIHVHHLQALSQVGQEYQVDPVADLRPVCPNCHAIIHRRKPAYGIEEVKTLLSRSGRR